MKFYVKIGVPNWEEAKNWGDFHFARAMGKGLEALGHQVVIQILPEWNRADDVDSDVTIHLMGLSRYRVKRGPLNVLWIISHPDKAMTLDLNRYDLVFVASASLACHLAGTISSPVHELLQFADTFYMYPDCRPELKTDLLFVGNSRKVFRKIVREMLTCSWPVKIWGSNWEMFVPSHCIMGQYYPYETLRRLYSSCAILLNDHWEDMRRWNLVNNRIFDALACKTLVVSDHVADIGRLFGDAVITYQDRDDLCARVGYYLDREEERRELVESGYQAVVTAHGVQPRMAEMLEKLNTPGLRPRSGAGPFRYLRKLLGM